MIGIKRLEEMHHGPRLVRVVRLGGVLVREPAMLEVLMMHLVHLFETTTQTLNKWTLSPVHEIPSKDFQLHLCSRQRDHGADTKSSLGHPELEQIGNVYAS